MKANELAERISRFDSTIAAGVLDDQNKALLCLMHQAAMLGEIAHQLAVMNERAAAVPAPEEKTT